MYIDIFIVYAHIYVIINVVHVNTNVYRYVYHLSFYITRVSMLWCMYSKLCTRLSRSQSPSRWSVPMRWGKILH